MFDPYAELRQLVAALEAEGIPYAVCGGLALAVHGAPRATKDIDLLALPEGLVDIHRPMELERGGE